MTWDRTVSLRRLRTAVETLDYPRVAALCDDLVAHLQSADAGLSRNSAKLIMDLLRRKRHFRLMQQVGDALLQAGLTYPVIRRQYAQALLDQGILHAAVAVLDRLIVDTTGESGEEAEARGLLVSRNALWLTLAGIVLAGQEDDEPKGHVKAAALLDTRACL